MWFPSPRSFRRLEWLIIRITTLVLLLLAAYKLLSAEIGTVF